MAEKDFVDSAVDEIEARTDAAVDAVKVAGGAATASAQDIANAVYAITGEMLDVGTVTLEEAAEFARKRTKDSAAILRALKRIATG